jgi:hypothetical protein
MSMLGKKSAEKMTVEERKERARNAVKKRWEQKRNRNIIKNGEPIVWERKTQAKTQTV